MSPVSQRRNGVIVLDQSGVMTRTPACPSGTGRPDVESMTSSRNRSVQATIPGPPSRSTAVIEPSVMPKLL